MNWRTKTEPCGDGDSVLIAGVNWLGDSVMTLPAIHLYHRENPGARIIMLVKPKLRSFWLMYPAIDEVLDCAETVPGIVEAIRAVRRLKFDIAYILPHSFRSALVPFIACIPHRVGLPGHHRDWMLSRVVKHQSKFNTMGSDRRHQCYEYMDMFGVSEDSPEMPRLTIPREILGRVQRRLAHYDMTRIGLLPGAAYGPSKRWPPDFFITTGRMLKDAFKCNILVFGLPSEGEICGRVASGIGTAAVDLAGQTSLPELAAMLSLCALVIANDSGGMHLATAVETPVVAIYGITDPDKTGPLSRNSCVLQDSSIRNADLERESEVATMSLNRILPEHVLEAACKMLGNRR